MMPFEEYLQSLGYKPFIEVYQHGSFRLENAPQWSSLSSIDRLQFHWIKGDNMFIYGLNENGHNATLISPRPNGLKYYRDFEMDRLFKKYSCKEIHDACLDKSINLFIDNAEIHETN